MLRMEFQVQMAQPAVLRRAELVEPVELVTMPMVAMVVPVEMPHPAVRLQRLVALVATAVLEALPVPQALRGQPAVMVRLELLQPRQVLGSLGLLLLRLLVWVA